jgi:hypothetical protein
VRTARSPPVCTSPNARHQHVSNIFAKLDLPPDDGSHRRVTAVLTYLGARPEQ